MKSIKSLLLTISGFITLFILVANIVGNFYICGGLEWSRCVDDLANLQRMFYVFIPTFLFSLCLWKVKASIFNTWSTFALVWIPMSVLAVFLAPEYRTDFLYGFDKSSVAFLMSMLFVVGSLCILAWQRKHL